MSDTSRTIRLKLDADARGITAAVKEAEREVDDLTKSTDHLSKSTRNATKISDDHASALGRLRVAQLRQAEVQKRSNPSAAAIAAAEESVKSAERAVKKFEKAGNDSGRNFNQSLKKWFSPAALGKIGEEGGSVFGDGFKGALKTPIIGPAIAGALIAAVAVAAPAAGAVAASGLVLAFGAGLAGLGLVFASKSKVVQDTWKKTLSGMSAQLTLLSKPFEATLVSIAGFAQRTFAKFAPDLGAAFKSIAPTVTKFADTVSKGLEQLRPAVLPLADAFNAVLDSLGPAIQGAIGHVSDGLIRLSESVKKNPDGLADLVDNVGELTGKLLTGIAKLNDFNGKIKDLTGGTSAVDLVFGKANSKIGEFIGKVKSTLDPLGGLKGAVDALVGSNDKAGNSVEDLGDKATLSGGAASDMGAKVAAFNAAAGAAGKGADGLAPKIESLATKFDRQWQATQRSNQELFRNSGLLLSLSGSEIAYQAAVDDATESIKQNGKTHDINTEKGRANKTALDQVSASANAQTEAMRNAGDGNVAAAKHGEEARKNFVKLAEQMGYTKPQAEAMAKSMIAIPNVSRTAKLNANIADLESKLATAKTKLKDPKLTATQRAKLEANIKNLESGIATAKGLLAGVPKSKTVTITVNTYKNLIETTINRGLVASGKGVPRASGGPVQPNRSYLVGERGPEILQVGGSGSRIMNAEQTAAALAGGGSQPIIVENHIEIGGEVVRVVRTEIKQNDANTKRRLTAGVRA